MSTKIPKDANGCGHEFFGAFFWWRRALSWLTLSLRTENGFSMQHLSKRQSKVWSLVTNPNKFKATESIRKLMAVFGIDEVYCSSIVCPVESLLILIHIVTQCRNYGRQFKINGDICCLAAWFRHDNAGPYSLTIQLIDIFYCRPYNPDLQIFIFL